MDGPSDVAAQSKDCVRDASSPPPHRNLAVESIFLSIRGVFLDIHKVLEQLGKLGGYARGGTEDISINPATHSLA